MIGEISVRPFKRLFYVVLVAIVVAFGLGGCRKEETRQLKQETLPLVSAPKSPLPTPNVQASPLRK
jgi:hypothetical protein